MDLTKHLGKLNRTVCGQIACVAIGALTALSGCSRDHIEAINLANQGDQAVTVNVSGAVQKYEAATRLDPSNHRIFWKLGMAYQKQEEWSKMETALSSASRLAPDFADYFFYRGRALIHIAVGGNADAYEDAKKPLAECVKLDPNFAECYHFLGEANLWTGNEQAAVDNYSKAIEKNPKMGFFYVPLADTYVNLRLYDAAEKVLRAGESVLDKIQKNKNALYNIYTLLYKVHQAKGDIAGGVGVLEQANKVAGDSHPEIAFNLGSAYAVMKPPKKDKAIRLLKSFNKRACRSKKASTKFKDQCETSSALVQKLGGS